MAVPRHAPTLQAGFVAVEAAAVDVVDVEAEVVAAVVAAVVVVVDVVVAVDAADADHACLSDRSNELRLSGARFNSNLILK